MSIEPNAELLEQTMAYIETHPEEHEQEVWYDYKPCGTSCCFAGRAALLVSPTSVPPPLDENHQYLTWTVKIGDGPEMPVWKFAQQKLGLTDNQADALFDENNSVEDLRDAVDALKAGDDGELFSARYYPEDDEWFEGR